MGTKATCRLAYLLCVVTIGIQACGGSGDITTRPTAPVTPSSSGTFTLSAEPVIVLQGGSAESKITVVRSGGFTGSVTLAVTGAPAGLTAAISPSVTSETTATLVVTTTSSVSAFFSTGGMIGNVALTISGTATGRTDQTATATVTITPNVEGTGNVVADFSACPAEYRPIWFAVQDGSGPWTQVLGSADVYRFNVVSARGGYASVMPGKYGNVSVTLASKAELTSATGPRCGPQATKAVSGTLAGFSTNDVVYVGLGGGWTGPEGGPAAREFTISGVLDGAQDFIAYRSGGSDDRVIIRRDQIIPNNGTVGTVDFTAAEAFVPAAARLQVTGSDRASLFMSYLTGPGCVYAGLYDQSYGSNFRMWGIPAALQRANDFHFVTVYQTDEPSYRAATESFHTLADRVVALPAPLPTPRITAPLGGHKRLQASLTLPSEYQRSLMLMFLQGERYAWLSASYAWLGGPSATLTFPDLSGVTGWRSSFLPPSSASVGWILEARGGNSEAAGGACVENGRSVVAQTYGKE